MQQELIQKVHELCKKRYPVVGVYGFPSSIVEELRQLEIDGALITIYFKDASPSTFNGYPLTNNFDGFIDRMDVIIDVVNDGSLNKVKDKVLLALN